MWGNIGFISPKFKLFVVTDPLQNTQENATLSDNVCFALYTAANALMRAYRPLLERYELTYPQYLVMQALWLQDRISLTQVSLSTRLDMGTLTPIVKRLEAKGFLQRLADTTDERKKVIALTDSGKQLKVEALALKQTLLDKVAMSNDDVEQLRQLCLTLTQELT
ncbi:MarR family winged helix-turn-helix transcriptional regulator [Shewanella pneumatophori]|uniref:MarR family transcriptional regulator n=1 Tax=Shewanella pneumatophori TaxID=314092 RepID=A0A9X1ZBH5_9GAMM|nr:MarR family transcriptional regulator [Shewanella pneumatophori]MCL1139199.1 MarR family transcriptional regulator [Shewanella pneumatophori]